MLHALLYNGRDNTLRVTDREGLLAYRLPCTDSTGPAAPNGTGATTFRPLCHVEEFVWLDIVDPDEDDYRMLADKFNLHPLVLEDVKENEGRPKLHEYGSYLYIILHSPQLELRNQENHARIEFGKNPFDLEMHEIDCLVGPDYIIT